MTSATRSPPVALEGAAVTVMGLGRFGGGLGVTRWLAEQGAEVLVTDRAEPARLEASLAALDDLVQRGVVRLRLGAHNVSDFTTCDLVIANPAVPRPWDDRHLRAAAAAGVPVTTEIRLLTERLDRRRVIAVTGSSGKSTTAAMIHHLLLGLGEAAVLGGNIGGSLLGALDGITDETRVVLELSSAQLHWLGADVGFRGAAGFSPHVAVLTNIEPNHLDWHGDFAHYAASKRNIFRYQQKGDHAVIGEDLDARPESVPLALPGAHNQRNALVAATAVRRATGRPVAETAARLADFPGLPHRLRLIAEVEGRRCYDDSKATTPAATRLAVAAFERPELVHLVAGGYDKGLDLVPIADLAATLGGLYTVGVTGPTIARQARTMHPTSPVFECGTVAQAVRDALARMGADHVLLLSPGCASWDQFDSYEQRGRAFAAAVKELTNG